MSSIASIESELRNQLSSIPRLPLRWHPLSWRPKSKGDICPSPYDFYAFPSISFVFPLAFVVWGVFPSRFSRRFLTHARTCAPSLRFPLFCFHNLHTRPISNSKNRVAVVAWHQCWKSRDCATFQGEICEVVKICSKVLVATWYKERYAEICEGCESKKA